MFQAQQDETYRGRVKRYTRSPGKKAQFENMEVEEEQNKYVCEYPIVELRAAYGQK